MKYIIATVGILMLCALFIPVNGFTQEWEIIREMENAVLFSRPFEDTEKTQFKIETTVSASEEEIVSLLRDIPTYPAWFGDCNNAKVLERKSRDFKITYLEFATPWPLRNRVIISEVEYIIGSESSRVDFNTHKNSNVSIEDKFVKVPFIYGYCTIDELSDRNSEVEFALALDPGGNVSTALANNYTKQQIIKIHKGLVRSVSD